MISPLSKQHRRLVILLYDSCVTNRNSGYTSSSHLRNKTKRLRYKKLGLTSEQREVLVNAGYIVVYGSNVVFTKEGEQAVKTLKSIKSL